MMFAFARKAFVPHAELPYHYRAEQVMVMLSTQPRRWTVREVSHLIEARPAYTPRYELVDGELLVTPAPTRWHQRVIIQLAFRLQPYVAAQRVGELLLGPDVRLREGTLFEPDLCVVPAPDGRLDKKSNPISHPLLICEALSPSSVRHDRFTKRRAFQRDGVPDYWVVDSEARTFEVWHPGDEEAAVIDERLTWRAHGCTAPFDLDVKAFFAEIADGAPVR